MSESVGSISQIQVGNNLYDITVTGAASVEEYTENEILTLILENPNGITPINNAAGESF